jgi:peptidoglycan hydrolase-like protein with peptidoglycan-binding domain
VPEVSTAADTCTLELPVLYFGAKGEPVRAMQQLLLAKGYDLPRWGDDGDFGAETERALSAMQSDGCIEPSGICEAASWGLLLGLGAA